MLITLTVDGQTYQIDRVGRYFNSNASELDLKMVLAQHPHAKQTIYNQTLGIPEIFYRLVPNVTQLRFALQLFPERRDYFFNLAFGNHEVFSRFIQIYYDLSFAVRLYPDRKEEFFDKSLAKPDIFKRLIRDSIDLSFARNLFSNHPELKSNIIDQIKQNLKEIALRKEKIKLFADYKTLTLVGNKNSFYALPKDVLLNIVSLNADSNLSDEEERKVFCRVRFN